MRAIGVSVGALALAWAAAATAQDDPREAVPPELEPWVPWVLADVPDHGCPVSQGGTLCAWTGRLKLELSESGGAFEQEVVADWPSWFVLPGDDGHWPQEVRVDGSPTPVLARDGRPAVRLARGAHRIDGRFRLERLPEVLPVPPETALVDLSLDGEPVAHPRREGDGTLWLRRRAEEGGAEARLDLRVARRVRDDVPLRIATRIELDVGGRPREVDLGDVGLPATVPLRVDSEIPARIDPEGHLVVQVVAGEHTVEVEARTEGEADVLRAPELASPWPEHEVWVWEGDDALRQVDLEGPPAVDPARTHLEGAWAELPAYVLRPGAELRIVTLRRGEREPPPNGVTLERDLWLDLDGGGYTVRDRIRGTMRRDWRLDLTGGGELGRVAVDGEDRLVTTSPDGGHTGVELRRSDLDLVAEWRSAGAIDRMPAVGWSSDVQGLSWRLHLPPGWSVLSVAGVDEASGTWLGSWDLFDFFFVLVVSLAIARLFGWRWGALALLMLVLSHREPGAPHWVWASLVAAVAVLRVLPRHWTRTLARGWWAISVAVLATLAVPFALDQVREALHPQVGRRGGAPGLTFSAPGAAPAGDMAQVASDPAPTAAPVQEEAVAESAEPRAMDGDDASRRSSRGGEGYTRKAPSKQLEGLEQDPNAVVQTGPGVPSWSWRTFGLSWSGPVGHDHRVRLWLLPPWLNAIFNLLRVALVLLLGVLLVRRSWPGGRAPGTRERSPAGTGSTAAASAAAVLCFALSAGDAEAQPAPPAPDPGILQELKSRLTKGAPCRPDCVSAPEARVGVDGRRLSFEAEVHAGEATSFRLPGPATQWVPGEVLLDGEETAGLARRDDGYIHLRVPPGTHRVEVRGPLAGDALTLQLPDPVNRLVVGSASGWKVEGVGNGQLVSSIQLTRVRTEAGEGETSVGRLPPWLHVRRTLHAGVAWRVHTVVRRVSPTGSPVTVRVPLLEGESVQRADLDVTDGHAVVALGDDAREVAWWSSVKSRSELRLEAPRGVPWSETWELVCGAVWRCAIAPADDEGPPPVAHVDEGRWRPSFRPWPGEQLTWRFARPDAAPGRSVTIDAAELEVEPGVRLERSTLTLTIRSSSGGVQRIGVPGDARVQSLTVDGVARPFRQQGEAVDVGLAPGSQTVALEWQRAEGMGLVHRAPRVVLDRPVANARVAVRVPAERWLLGVAGPGWGPAVLFWSYLAVVLLFAWLLARVPGSPLRGWQWALLGVGLTQVHPAAALVVVGWLFALRWRRDRPPERAGVFDLVQVLLFFGTLAALGVLYVAVHRGLLVQPDMQVAGGGSSQSTLRWYVDRVSDALPASAVWSVPLWVWKALMLLWSLWLAWSLVRWLPWAWRCFSEGGLWRRLRKPRPASPAPATSPAGGAVPGSAATEGAKGPTG
ncbi:MAG: hypothetical protein ACOC97_02725 [Myxococcota bacterium]